MALEIVQTQIGKAKITQIIELEIGHQLAWLIPDTTPDNIRAIDWLKEPYRNADYSLNAISQSFIIEIGNRILVVDTCIGNDKTIAMVEEWNKLQLGFLDALTRAGIDREAVTDVLCTHMHIDHVGWNTHLDEGVWRPTFPNARYHFARGEYEFWKQDEDNDTTSFSESIDPIFDAGLADLIEAPCDLGDGISVVPTPGHTHSHIAVAINAGDEQFYIVGDAIHHPCQIARPEWATVGDYDKSQSTATRHALLAEVANTSTRIAGIHFSIPSFGRIITNETGDHVFTTNV